MKHFQLDAAEGVWQFDTNGDVHDTAANHVGRWSTNGQNQIMVNKAGDESALIDVSWAFDDKNRLTISQGGKVVFTLANTTDGLAGYRLDDANRLMVDPDGDRDFEFGLTCRYALDPAGNLIVGIGAQQFTIEGFIEDSSSRFRFLFDDREMPTFPSSLVFKGHWERVDNVENEIQLRFVLNDPALVLPGGDLMMPAVAKVDPARNHLAIVYTSTSKGERRLQFQGSFTIRPDFTLEFRIDQVKDGGVRKSSITVATTFEWDVVRGALQLHVGKERRPESQVIEVSGALQATLSKGQLNWNFAYRKATSGGTTTVTLATQLEFVFDNGEVLIEYEQDGKHRSLNISGKLKKDDLVLTGGVAIARDPEGRRLGAFLGVSW